MKELIKVTTNEQGQQVVSAKELYLNLGMDKSQWSRWYQKNILDNDFVSSGIDWEGFDIMSNGNLVRDFAITIDFAKRISMMARTEKGEIFRTYFIECEKKLTELALPSYQIEDDVLRAEAWIREKKQHLLELENKDNKIKALEPKAEFYDAVANTSTTFDFAQVAKTIGFKYGNKTLFKKLRDMRILDSNNIPYQQYVTAGYFQLKQKTYNTDNGIKVSHQARFTEKGIKWLVNNKEKLQ